MMAEGVPHFLEVEGSHRLGSWPPTLLSSSSNFCDSYFNQLYATLLLGFNIFILSCSNLYVRVSDLKLETVTEIPSRHFSIEQVPHREY